MQQPIIQLLNRGLISDPRAFLKSLFEAAVRAADPYQATSRHLPPPPKGRTVVIGARKGAGQMAAALEQAMPRPFDGLVVTPHGPTAICSPNEGCAVGSSGA